MKRRRAARSVRRAALVPAALTAAVDPGRRLSQGAVVQGSVRARLLGLPLLRLDATVVLMPTRITAPSSALPVRNGLAEAVRSINEGERVLADGRRRRAGDV